MNTYDEQFIGTLVDYYPLERYIFYRPQSLNTAFDDMFLKEIYIHSNNEIYVKIAGKDNIGEITIGYFDFADYIREAIRGIFVQDFGADAYQGLYTDDEECVAEMKEKLRWQKTLIATVYGNYTIRDTPNSSIFKDTEVGG